MWPVHTWLPDAHVEAPTAGSVLLAAILLKMAGYGFIRFSIGLFPVASEYFVPLVYVLSIIAIIYTSLVALMQDDMKKLIAYSSVAHMGFVTLGIFTMTQQGIEGSIIQMISHGLISAALFLCVGVIYDRKHSRQIKDYGGLVSVMPKYAIFITDYTYEFAMQVDEILGFCTLLGKQNVSLGKSQESVFQIENLDDYGSVKVIDVKNLELDNSLEAPKEKKLSVGEFEVGKTKKATIEKYFTFSLGNEFFAFDLAKVRRVYHKDSVRMIDNNSSKGFFLADFNDLICPVISDEKRKNIFQVFVFLFAL